MEASEDNGKEGEAAELVSSDRGVYGFLQAFFISKETPTAERRKEKETLK
jgi:hypothetical protein